MPFRVIILSGGPGNGHEANVPDDNELFIWFTGNGAVEYRPMVQDGMQLPVYISGTFKVDPNYNPDEPF